MEKSKIQEVHQTLGIHDWLYRHVNLAKKGKERYYLSSDPKDSAVRICECCDVIEYGYDSKFRSINTSLSKLYKKNMKRLRRYRKWKIQRE